MFSYDAALLSESTAEGRRYFVRLRIGDTEDTADHPAIFQDEELDGLLEATGDSVYYAAAEACEAWARTHSRLAKRMERDGTIHERWSPKELLATAEVLRARAVTGLLTGNLQFAQIVSSDQGYLEERRPIWVSVLGTENPPL